MARLSKSTPPSEVILRLPPGAHICQVYTTDEERDELLYDLLAAGLAVEERCVCCSDHFKGAVAQARWTAQGVDLKTALDGGRLSVHGCQEAYLPTGRFDPAAMLDFITDLHDTSLQEGFPGVRIIGEMPADIRNAPGGDRILEYECRVSLLLEQRPVAALCQYDARNFDGATILEILKVHPVTISHGAVVSNPFYVPPLDYLDAL